MQLRVCMAINAFCIGLFCGKHHVFSYKNLKQNKDVIIALIGTYTDEVSDRKRRIKMLQDNLMNQLESHSDLKN
jgi:hypothetical protein